MSVFRGVGSFPAQSKWIDYSLPDRCGIGWHSFVMDVTMAPRVLRCAIEEVADYHPNLYVEPHVAAFVAVAGQYSASPALFNVECGNVASRWLGKSAACRLEVSWRDTTWRRQERSGP